MEKILAEVKQQIIEKKLDLEITLVKYHYVKNKGKFNVIFNIFLKTDIFQDIIKYIYNLL